jgi:hypothetical protein
MTARPKWVTLLHAWPMLLLALISMPIYFVLNGLESRPDKSAGGKKEG